MIRIVSLLILFSALSMQVAVAAQKTILVLGDSIAAGYGLDPEDAFPALLQEKIDQSGLKYKVVNGGVSGDTTAGGLRRIGWLLRNPVDVLLLELGGNDGLRGIDPTETEKNLQGIIEKVRQKNPNAQILIAGMQMPENMGKEYTTRYREVFARVAKQNNATLIPFLLEGVGGKAELNQADRIHPTAEGHRIIAATIWKVLQPVLGGTTRSREMTYTPTK
ncbi:MAG TPA: arylesterase [Candidatus Kapabacteria bacterium]|nr:arylesterase [Candidatus Kapabacteria bacterium]